MFEPLLTGLLASAPLAVGAVIGIYATPPQRAVAVVLAFAAGTMIAALSFELVAEADQTAPISIVALGLGVGAFTFVAADLIADRHAARLGIGGALLIGVLLDGIPENLALGASLDEKSGGLALLVAIAIGNVPEALGGAAEMRDKLETRSILVLWVVAAALTALAVPLGSLLLDDASGNVSGFVLAFAAGAIISVVADTALPRAFEEGGPWIALATSAGFLVGYVLGVD